MKRYDLDDLRRRIEKGQGTRQIALELGRNYADVANALVRHGLVRYRRPEIAAQWAEHRAEWHAGSSRAPRIDPWPKWVSFAAHNLKLAPTQPFLEPRPAAARSYVGCSAAYENHRL